MDVTLYLLLSTDLRTYQVESFFFEGVNEQLTCHMMFLRLLMAPSYAFRLAA